MEDTLTHEYTYTWWTKNIIPKSLVSVRVSKDVPDTEESVMLPF